MAYAFMTIQKVKNMGTLKSKYNHNCRQVEVSNVIPEFINDNDTLVPLPTGKNGKELSYDKAVANRIEELEYHKTHRALRSDAVLAYEVVMTFSQGMDVDINEWEKRSVEWLKNTFDVAPDGKSNIVHAICHKDEPGNVHIHAIVTPVDAEGKFNARAFTGGARALANLQTSYAKSLEDIGIERGISGSSASHKSLRKLYAELNNQIDKVPPVLEGETAEEYRLRTFEFQQNQLGAMLKAKYDEDRKLREKRDHELAQAKARMKEETELAHSSAAESKEIYENYKLKIGNIETELAEKTNQSQDLQNQISSHVVQLAKLKQEIQTTIEQKEFANEMHTIREGIEYVMQKNPKRANEFLKEMDYFKQAGEEVLAQNLESDAQNLEPKER